MNKTKLPAESKTRKHKYSRCQRKDANVESTLIDTSTLDGSCVESLVKKYLVESTGGDISPRSGSCVESLVKKYLEQRCNKGELEILDEKGNKITTDELIDILYKIDAQITQNRHKIGNNETSNSIEGGEK